MRKTVLNEQVIKAYGHLNATMEELTKEQQNNRRIMQKVMSKYTGLIPEDDLSSCAMQGLWRCLSYHEDGRNKKFTTNLWQFVEWECRRELRKRKKKETDPSFMSMNEYEKFDAALPQPSDDSKYIYECIDMLPDFQKTLIHQYYIENRTMEEIGKLHGFSKEAARQNIKKAVTKLQELFIDKN